jgi:5-methyltetrahydropteroyltriglutamate--homocysteine methyltransferase
VRARGEDPEALVAQYIAAINEAVRDRPADMVAGVHLCRGNYKGRWLSEGGYDSVAERLFNEANVDVFFLEYDTPRAGDFAPLRFLPRQKHAVLGLVSSKLATLEDRDALARRLDDAAKVVSLDQLGLSPQCGFASAAGGNPVTEQVQRAKLRLCCDVAHDVWR